LYRRRFDNDLVRLTGDDRDQFKRWMERCNA
jgi:hypothetical protein